MRGLVEHEGLQSLIELDSAGTGAWHEGEKADARSAEVAQTRGIKLTSRARPFQSDDFKNFDNVIYKVRLIDRRQIVG